jgi:hypothetical protein
VAGHKHIAWINHGFASKNSKSVLQEMDSTGDALDLEPDRVAEDPESAPSQATPRARSTQNTNALNTFLETPVNWQSMAMSLELFSSGWSSSESPSRRPVGIRQ